MSRLTLPSRRDFTRHLLVAGGAGVALACAAPSQARDGAATGAAAGQTAVPIVVINHVSPRRDYVGAQPKRFEWSAVNGADRYAIGIWNEVDRLMWNSDRVADTFATPPADFKLEAGTYFWMVSAVREDRQIADSGLAAFVVEV